ncbi:GntR family transcriptional regulator [Caulobacter sp.]|uniref:GntR family transcriptional regulator n=1 Tax=Caulobacter sp. TaxID=78 RepID=UPI0031E028D3
MIEKAGTGDRVYLAIKSFLLDESDHRPGDRIDVADLARRVGASATPVRAALHRMSGERLLVSHQGEGFSAPRITEVGLTDLYTWNAAVLGQALRTSHPGSAPPLLAIPEGTAAVVRVERLFALIAALSDNVELEWAVAGLNDRMHRIRRVEEGFVADAEAELAGMEALLKDYDLAGLRLAIPAYHRRRLKLVPSLSRALHGLGDRPPRQSI